MSPTESPHALEMFVSFGARGKNSPRTAIYRVKRKHDEAPAIMKISSSFVLLCLTAVVSAQTCIRFPTSRTAASCRSFCTSCCKANPNDSECQPEAQCVIDCEEL
ncbi:hypothetical protein SISSUDRAFT_836166 [Sistotremastrum suecicum HHB10207 ss-3]|uniref:Uncharacterized protein n=1 Tax=Sistotremastrum suecicum HHB10207 ss-3 TaxID=1314776 RepID=A0A166CKL0_9AGAM|nr:hypothetical protein SISSUDRAFT_836166 [Sistotremastrum suecicum HHB10207 ss-3]